MRRLLFLFLFLFSFLSVQASHMMGADVSYKCLGQDTFFMTRISIELCTTTGVKTIVKGEPKLIKIYDVMGRPVQHIRKEEVLIYLYDDGSTKKVLIH